MGKTDYQKYLESPAWQATRQRRLAKAEHRCEYQPVIGNYKTPGDILGERCAVTDGLEVHHRHYLSLGRESDRDLEVLCRFHHLVAHANKAECERCGESIFNGCDDDDAIMIVQDAINNNGGIGNVTVRDLDVPGHCDYCDHVLTKDD